MKMNPWQELPTILTLIQRGRKSIETYQDARLRRLIQDVYSGNAFYRRLWDEAGFDPGKFQGVADLHRLPLINKQRARAMTSMLREKLPADKNVIWHSTSGTSGEPFTLARSWHEERFLTVVRTLVLRSLGFRARLRQARIRVPADFDWLKDRPLRLLNTLGFYRSRILSCFDPPEFLWQQVSDYVPDVLMGYSETVARVARYGLETRRSDIHPRFVLLGGELCTPLMSRHISEAFRAPVYQTYAATEFNLIGWSCPQSGLFHLCDPTVLVEVLDNQGNPVAEGETGVLVATALHSRVMPFIRYALGDRVVKGPTPCPCGAPFGTLKSIDGREIDHLRLKNGDMLHAFELLNILLEFGAGGWMRQYQLIQNEPGVIEARIWPLRAPDPGVLDALAARLEKAAKETPIRIKLVDRMDLDLNGKFHACRCLV
jgi:phenylacetate-CoA ligase